MLVIVETEDRDLECFIDHQQAAIDAVRNVVQEAPTRKDAVASLIGLKSEIIILLAQVDDDEWDDDDEDDWDDDEDEWGDDELDDDDLDW